MINSKESEEASGKEETSAGNSSVERGNKKTEDHRVLLERYEQRLKNLDPELITPDDEIALKEAFVHAKEVFEPEELVSWFTARAEPFYRSGSWKVLFPLYEELLEIAEKKLGTDNPETADCAKWSCRNLPLYG